MKSTKCNKELSKNESYLDYQFTVLQKMILKCSIDDCDLIPYFAAAESACHICFSPSHLEFAVLNVVI